jgi:cysteine desulfuration protein SufE
MEVSLPERLDELVREVQSLNRTDRAETLIDYADRFVEVPPEVASRPFPEAQRAPRCESDAFVFVVDQPDGGLALHFAVENPQGISAKAWAVILDETLSGLTPEEISKVPGDVVFDIFGKDLSMGKGQGLLGMLEVIHHEARKRLRARRANPTS